MEQGKGFLLGPESPWIMGVRWWSLSREDGGGRRLGHMTVANGGEVARGRHALAVGRGDDDG